MDKIVCVGKNYLDHVAEMGGAASEKPVIFIKPPSVLRELTGEGDPTELTIPADAGTLHHECEIVLRLGKGGYSMSLAEASRAIEAVALGLDMTLRDKQTHLKKSGHPWTVSKVFLDSAVVGPWTLVQDFPDYLTQPFRFELDGKIRQQSQGSQMTMSPVECVAFLSHAFPLCPGDLIYTGTPSGVGPVTEGQTGTLIWGSTRTEVIWRAD